MCVGLDIDSFAMHDLAHFRDALQEAYDEMLNVGRHAEARSGRRPAGRARVSQRRA
jgi:hypothetical protein